MLELLADLAGWDSIEAYIPLLEKEYQFWMKGKDELSPQNPAQLRTVLLDKSHIGNRYFDHGAYRPRPESYLRDKDLSSTREDIYRQIRAACESGWDHSSRWLSAPRDLGSAQTTDLLPVDLNALLFKMEQYLAESYRKLGDMSKAGKFERFTQARIDLIHRYNWNPESEFFHDYNHVEANCSPVFSLAGLFPLFVGLATPKQADGVLARIKNQFLKPGGLLTTLTDSGQQWDYPNAWAPLQYIGFKAAERYGWRELATQIKTNWTNNVDLVYKTTGVVLEKYNAINPLEIAGGGEYPNQVGFGWTNGVYLAFQKG